MPTVAADTRRREEVVTADSTTVPLPSAATATMSLRTSLALPPAG